MTGSQEPRSTNPQDTFDDPTVGQAARVVMRESEEIIQQVSTLVDRGIRTAPVESAWDVLALLKHLAYVHRYWCGQVLTGVRTDSDFPWTEEDPDADWRVDSQDTLASLTEFLRQERDTGLRLIRHRTALEPGTGADATANTTTCGVLVHLVQELARHAGQLDILVERCTK